MREPLFVVGSDPVLGRLRRLRVPVLVGALFGLLVGVAVHRTTPPTFTAQVAIELSVLRDRIDLEPGGARGDPVSVDTDAQLVLSDPVVGAIAAAEQRPERQVRSALLVTARPLSRILMVSYTTRTADLASRGARLAGEQFLIERGRAYLDPQTAFLGAVQRETEQITPELEEVITAGTVPTSENLRRRGFVEGMTMPGPGQIVSGPRLTAVQDRGDVEVPLATGLGTGALLAVLLVVGVDLLRGRPAGQSRSARPARRSGRRARPPAPRRVLAGALVVTAAVTGVVGAAAYLVLPQRYTALAVVYVPPLAGNAYRAAGSPNAVLADLGTEAELARADRVLDAVAAAPGVDATADQLRARIRSTPSERGETIEITVTGGSAAGAEQVAALVAQEGVLARQERALTWTTRQRTAVGSAVSQAEADLAAVLGPDGDEALVNGYNRRLTLLRTDVRGLDGGVAERGTVLSVRATPSGDDRLLLLAVAGSGLALGLLVAVATRGATRVPFSARRAWVPGSVPGRAPRSLATGAGRA